MDAIEDNQQPRSKLCGVCWVRKEWIVGGSNTPVRFVGEKFGDIIAGLAAELRGI